MTPRARLQLAAAAVALALLAPLASCGRPADAPSSTPAATHTFEAGPLTVDISLDKPAITVAERLRVRIDAAASSGYTVQPLSIGEKLGDFTVVQSAESPPRLGKSGATVTSTELLLDPFLAGDYELPPIEVRAEPVDSAQGAEPVIVSTAPIAVAVSSVLAPSDADAEIAQLKPIAEPPPASRVLLVAAIAAGAAAIAVFLALAYAFLKRRAFAPPPPIPPHEAALARLHALLARQLLERGERKLFYIEISDILRRYIEDRFAIHAPERTTEEFLREVGAGAVFDPAEVAALREFLSHCDLVKFAEYAPTTDQTDNTIRVVRDFIDRTKDPAPPEAGPPPPDATRPGLPARRAARFSPASSPSLPT